jgi:hypothetical protein
MMTRDPDPAAANEPSQTQADPTHAGATTADSERPLHWRSRWGALIVSSLCRAILTSVAGLLAWSLAPAVFGWHTTVVMSGSMSPRLTPGDVVVSRPVPTQQLKDGEILLVHDPDHPGGLRMHRLVATHPSGMLTLRGDANRQADHTQVPKSAVMGVASLCIPTLGLPVYWLDSGDYGQLVVPVLLIALAIVGAGLYRRPPRDAAAPEEAGETEDPKDSPHAKRRRRRRFGLLPTSLSLVLIVTTCGVLGTPRSIAATIWNRTTVDTGDTWSATDYFSCTQAVAAATPYLYYRVSDTAGPTATDSSGNALAGTYQGSGTTFRVPGACPRDNDPGITLNGTSGYISTPSSVTNPSTFTLETWFKTTTNNGGDLISFGSSQTGTSSSVDRLVVLSNNGMLTYFVNGSSVSSGTGLNDGKWHLMDAVLAGPGMQLYVDGLSVATKNGASAASMTGYWRIGFDDVITALAGQGNGKIPNSNYFSGSLDEVAIYNSALTSTQIADHYYAS